MSMDFSGVDFGQVSADVAAGLVPDVNGNLPGMPEYVNPATDVPVTDGSAAALAAANQPFLANITSVYNSIGGRVTGDTQTRLDEIYAGVQSGKYSAADALAAFNSISQGPSGAPETGDGTGDGTGTGLGAKAGFVPAGDARITIKSILEQYGLGDLADIVYSNYVNGTVDVNNPEAVLFSIKNTPTYQKRFAANSQRAKAGLQELSPGTYIGLENFYRDTMKTNGLPTGFYDQTDDFTNLIANDISVAEFNTRIQDGYNAVANADPEVKRQMTELYGVSEGQLAAYFIDPARTAPILANQARASRIAARGKELAGIQLTGTLAEDLASRGITDQGATAGFTQLAGYGELRQNLAGEDVLTQGEQIGAAFGTSTTAADVLSKKRQRRVGEFAGGGGFVRTRGETSGGSQLAVGTAQ